MSKLYAGFAVLLLFAVYTWFIYGAGQDDIRADMAETVQKAVKKARADEQKKQEKINATIQKQYDEQAAINDRLNDDLNRLRKRPDRRHVPDNTDATCQGATGAELSRQDSNFLTREAARADRLRTALKTCYTYADTVESKIQE